MKSLDLKGVGQFGKNVNQKGQKSRLQRHLLVCTICDISACMFQGHNGSMHYDDAFCGMKWWWETIMMDRHLLRCGKISVNNVKKAKSVWFMRITSP